MKFVFTKELSRIDTLIIEAETEEQAEEIVNSGNFSKLDVSEGTAIDVDNWLIELEE